MPKIKDHAVTFMYGGEDLTGEQFLERLETQQDPIYLRRMLSTLVLSMEATRHGYQLPGCAIDLEVLRPMRSRPSVESDLGKDGAGKLIDGVDTCLCDIIQGSHSCECGPNCSRKKGTLNVDNGTTDGV